MIRSFVFSDGKLVSQDLATEALRLVRLEGHSAQSAADKLGLTLDTVQWRVRQALHHVRSDAGLGPAEP